MNENRLFDLSTGELCQYPFVMPEGIHYDPDATCPRWMQFLQEITCGDQHLEKMIKRMVGYCMTDSTSEQKMFVLLGDGSNGKSTFVDIVMMLLGDDYARTPMPELVFSERNTARNDCFIAALKDCRLAVIAEPSSKAKLCSQMVKLLVANGSRIVARQLYGPCFEFVPTFKIMVTTNYLPSVEGDDAAVWRRVCIVPFKASFAGGSEDKYLLEKLKRELPGIFNWALGGAEEWYAHGLPELVGGHHEQGV